MWLGRCYYYGWGTKQNKKKGIEILEKSSNQIENNENFYQRLAKEDLGEIFYEDENYYDFNKSVKYYKEALILGSIDSQLELEIVLFFRRNK